jgi:hypothetical protein
MASLSAHIPLLFGAIGSIITLISMTAVSVTGFHYLRAMEASQARIRAEQDTPRRTPQPY